MRAIGLDLSVRSTGLADCAGGLHTIRPRNGDGDGRLHEIALMRLSPFVRLDKPHLAVIERPVLARGGFGTGMTLAELHGAVKVVLTALHVPFVVVSPSTLKKFALGHAGSTKAPVTKGAMVDAARECGAEPANDDEADAWWLRAMALMRFDFWEPPFRVVAAREARLEVIGKMDWPAEMVA